MICYGMNNTNNYQNNFDVENKLCCSNPDQNHPCTNIRSFGILNEIGRCITNLSQRSHYLLTPCCTFSNGIQRPPGFPSSGHINQTGKCIMPPPQPNYHIPLPPA